MCTVQQVLHQRCSLDIGWDEPDAAQIANISNFLTKNKYVTTSVCYG